MPRNIGKCFHRDIHERLQAGPVGFLGRESNVVMTTGAVHVATTFRPHQRLVAQVPIFHILLLRLVGLWQPQHGMAVLHTFVVLLKFGRDLPKQFPSLWVPILTSATQSQPDRLGVVTPIESFLELCQLVLLLQQTSHV